MSGRASRLLRRVAADASGATIIEFALALPLLLTMGLFGAEMAMLAVTHMQVSQIALSLADNASRLGQTDNSGITPTIRDADVDAVIDGAIRQGDSINLREHGRVILSSVEYDSTKNRQYIHWQRCGGDLTEQSDYGDEGTRNGLNGTPLPPLGVGAQKITVTGRNAVMFVEIFYDYEGLFGTMFGMGGKRLRQEGAYLVRDDRNLVPGLTGGNSRSRC
jgi:hypothetical protein